MLVKDLIKKLSTMPQDIEVYLEKNCQLYGNNIVKEYKYNIPQFELILSQRYNDKNPIATSGDAISNLLIEYATENKEQYYFSKDSSPNRIFYFLYCYNKNDKKKENLFESVRQSEIISIKSDERLSKIDKTNKINSINAAINFYYEESKMQETNNILRFYYEFHSFLNSKEGNERIDWIKPKHIPIVILLLC